MKKRKKISGLHAFLACMLICFLSIFSGCGTLYQKTFSNPTFVLTYPVTDGIKMQPEIASIIVTADFSLDIDDQIVKGRGMDENESLHIIKGGGLKPYVVDILPGNYMLSISYSTVSSTGNQQGFTRYYTKEPVNISANLKAGKIYLIELKINGIVLTENLPDKITETIIESREKAAL